MNTTGLPSCVINCAAYDKAGQRTDITLDTISDVLTCDDGGFVWVGLYEPDEQTLDTVQDKFDLHDLAIEDAHNAHQRPKLETYGDSLFIAIHTAQTDSKAIHVGETHIFFGRRYIVTVRHGASSTYAATRTRLEREPELLQHGPSAALYAILDKVVDQYQPILFEFTQTLRTLENDIFAGDFHQDTIRELYDLKRELTLFRLAVSPLQDILGQLTRSRGSLVDAEIQLYFRDVLDHCVRVNEGVDMLREMLTTAANVNLSLVTIQQGEVVKRLGAWAALLAAPTLIASWYGMNFSGMPELSYHWSYLILVLLMFTICGVLYRVFKRADWL